MKILALLGVFLLCQFAHFLASIRMLWCIFVNPDRAWEIAKAYDRLGDAVANDNEVQTISARAYKASLKGKLWGCWLCKLLNAIQSNHCEDSVK